MRQECMSKQLCKLLNYHQRLPVSFFLSLNEACSWFKRSSALECLVLLTEINHCDLPLNVNKATRMRAQLLSAYAYV